MTRSLLASCCLVFSIATVSAAPLQPQAGESARMPGVPFDELARRASEAAEAGRLEEAVRYYQAGLELNPLWADGWWRLALIHFNAERWPEARQALERLVRIETDTGPSWALLGLSQYKLGDYAPALTSLSRAYALGVPRDQPLGREALHYLALLLIRGGQFAASAPLLSQLALLEADDPELVAACGLMALRIARLPAEVEPGRRELVTLAGRATSAAFAYHETEARQRFEELITRFPTTRGVHYAYGLFLSRNETGAALPMLRKEVELFPDHLEAQLEIAFQILDRGDAKQALAPAQAAVRLAPESATARLALGRALVANARLAQGIQELEHSERLAPDTRDVYLALAQAYAGVGRTADVARVRARLIELESRRGSH